MAKKKAQPETTTETITPDDVGTLDPGKLAAVPDPLPRGIDQEMYDSVKGIILSGFGANQSPDAIKSAIFQTGVPFSKLNRLYSIITKAEGLVVDPKIVTAGVKAEFEKLSLTFQESYADLAVIADDIAAAVNGATTSKITTMLKTLFKENEAEFPRKPAPTRGRMGIVNKTLINVFKENKEATQKECYEALVPVVKTLKNADDYSKQFHKMLFAVANNLSANEVLTRFSADN